MTIRRIFTLVVALVCALLAGTPARAQPTAPPAITLVSYAGGFNSPVDIVNSGVSGDGRLFIVEQEGVIRIVDPGGTVRATPFLDIQARVDSSDNEEGLLGLTFHPNYAANGQFYVNYTNTTGGVRRSRIAHFAVTADPNIADPNSESILLTVVQPFANHNAGDIAFGPDGYLYIPLGDGGSGGDPQNNAQTLTTPLGKLLRIDVDGGPGGAPDCVGQGTGGYTIPNSNPLSDGAGGTCDEIWALGLRNPWRLSFDRATGDLWLPDVGQSAWEEVNFQPASGAGGENYGWRCYEGDDHPYNTTGCGLASAYDGPIYEYGHGGTPFRCSVTGGFRYRGVTYPALAGYYLFADYCSGELYSLSGSPGSWSYLDLGVQVPSNPSTFGEDIDGELYVAGLGNGVIYRIVETTPTAVSLQASSATGAEGEKVFWLAAVLLLWLTLLPLSQRYTPPIYRNRS